VTLLEKARELNKIIQKSSAEPVVFDDICRILSDVLDCNVYVISKKGKIIGHRLVGGTECGVIRDGKLGTQKVPEDYNNLLLEITQTKIDIEEGEFCSFDPTIQCSETDKVTTIIPIVGNRERLGTLMLTRYKTNFTDEDLVLGEYSATIVGMELIRSRQEKLEEETRKKAVVQMAFQTLSYSELEAVEHIFNELEGNEGLVIASKIADKAGITRSVIVNAIRKFESAGVIQSRSLGMKGTHIKVLNEKIFDELKKYRDSSRH
jgi:transcriptional pleiotropic repressor